jgi:hypothetical protein
MAGEGLSGISAILPFDNLTRAYLKGDLRVSSVPATIADYRLKQKIAYIKAENNKADS